MRRPVAARPIPIRSTWTTSPASTSSSNTGREAARRVGDSFRFARIPVGKVYTSRFYRAVVTGRLIGGTEVAQTLDVTVGGPAASRTENDRRAQALRDLVATPPEAGTNTVVVTHKPNILDAFGRDWFEVKEGEASIFKPCTPGRAELVARLQVADWLNALR